MFLPDLDLVLHVISHVQGINVPQPGAHNICVRAKLGELDVISDSCLILGAVRLRQCVSREQELIISIPRKFAEFQSWR